jgi:hypothetical protein
MGVLVCHTASFAGERSSNHICLPRSTSFTIYENKMSDGWVARRCG